MREVRFAVVLATAAVAVSLNGIGCGSESTSASGPSDPSKDGGNEAGAAGGGKDASPGFGGAAGMAGGVAGANAGGSGGIAPGGSGGDGTGGAGCIPAEAECADGKDDDCDDATDCDDFDCSGAVACKCAVVPVPDSTTSRDIVFAAVGDLHAGDDQGGDPAIVQAINSIPAHKWPAGFFNEGKNYADVRGVIMLGDLTDGGRPKQGQLFRSTFGRCGTEGKLAYPTYEGYGNHDFPFGTYANGLNHVHPVIDVLDQMASNKTRPGEDGRLYYSAGHAGSGHYAWKWDDIWFVHLNVNPGAHNEVIDESTHDDCTPNCSGPCTPAACGPSVRVVDPHDATDFFHDFVQSLPLSSKQQLVVLSHYNYDSGRWPATDKKKFCDIIEAYRLGSNQRLSQTRPVAAFLHGHTHHGPVYEDTFPCGGVQVPQFNVGSPVCSVTSTVPQCVVCPDDSTDPSCPAGKKKYVHFTVFRLGLNWLEAVGISALRTDGTDWHVEATTPLKIMQ